MGFSKNADLSIGHHEAAEGIVMEDLFDDLTERLFHE